MKIISKSLLAALALGVSAPAAMATDINAYVKSNFAGYRQAETSITNSKVTDGGTLAVQNTDVAMTVRSGEKDNFNLAIMTNNAGYIRSETEISNVEVSGDAALAVQTGSFGLVAN